MYIYMYIRLITHNIFIQIFNLNDMFKNGHSIFKHKYFSHVGHIFSTFFQ